MSQVAAALGHEPACAVTAASAAATSALTNSEHDELREYNKIIQFRDTVVSGKHPRIKVPASFVVKNGPASQPPSSNAPERITQPSAHLSINNNVADGRSLGNMLSFKANSQQPAVTVPPAGSTPFIPGVSRPLGPGKPEIDPVLLQKSDGLVKAEIQIQRQRLEKMLRDQVEERKGIVRGNLQAEQLPELDISDILAKALTLVQATAPPAMSSLPSPTANVSDASDSFDENTFYSSQHNTPESRPSVPARNALENAQLQGHSTPAHQIASHAPPPVPLTSQSLPTPINHQPQTNIARSIAQGQTVGAQNIHPVGPVGQAQGRDMISTSKKATQNPLQQGHHKEQLETQLISSDSQDASRSDNSGNTDSEQSAEQHGLQNQTQLVPNPNFRQHEQPLIRGHNLSPFAPQPAHVSPLVVARQPHIRESDPSALQRVPAQVTALRQEHAVVISPESSPQGDKGPKKKNNRKKNKRKADARAQETQGSPNIKPEPRSPSPLTAPPLIRPQKRPRRLGRQEPEIIYDDPILERPSSQLQPERYPPAAIHVERVPQDYEGVDDPYSRQVRPSVAPVAHRLESPLYEERRPDGSIVRYVRHVASPAGYLDSYGAADSRPLHTSSYTVANPDVREVPTYHREGRMSVRPYPDRARSRSPIIVERRSSAMPPPSAPPRRIVIDEYGREYLEPVRTPVSRQSVVPPTRPGDHEIVYERAPIRATSRVPAPEIIGEDGVIYRRASPGYAPRRVITQPEYGSGFRTYRERDYPMQPMAPPSQDFVQIRGVPEHRLAEHLPREFLSRAASVRPVESVPYERLASTRPDRQYAASVHPDARREIAPHVGADYSIRPTEMDIPQRSYSVRPVERFYEQPPPREGDITYVERPRAAHQEVIYPGNGASRQVYQ
ncbi:hypothetical protein F5B22DRAFT_588212 [Xylaria bambusicola]|uniref:uncharacterized protein n=1 Tax=Xylaria bambusicola TaxID=326684 RepID=UPI002007776A|nr:uncharacterized protein F5B22DRAFT_588212 [Xylaria bambusicola]KAI0525906.1 hypothetical protein F5B22DRAFT_588212 [Xylaria bambusicola]